MLIAYLTTDEVNQAVAEQIAAEFEAVLLPLFPRDLPSGLAFDAMLCDLDQLPTPLRGSILAELLTGTPACPAAVHGYDLEDGQAQALSRNGVRVFRRLETEMFRMLCTTVHANGHTRGNLMSNGSDEPAPHRGRLEELLLAYLQASQVSAWPGVDGLTLDDVLKSYREAAAAGQVPDREMLRHRHGELAAEIDAFFADQGPVALRSVRHLPTPG